MRIWFSCSSLSSCNSLQEDRKVSSWATRRFVGGFQCAMSTQDLNLSNILRVCSWFEQEKNGIEKATKWKSTKLKIEREIVFCYINLSNLLCTKGFDTINFPFTRNDRVWKMWFESRFCYQGKEKVVEKILLEILIFLTRSFRV